MKNLIVFAGVVGALLYAAGVDFETTLGLDPAAVDTVLLVISVLGMLVMFVYMAWAAYYIVSGQYAIDRRLDEWIK